MKKIIILFAVLSFFARAGAQLLQPVDEKSEVKFVIKNFGVNTSGNFKGLEGTIIFDKDNPGKSSFDVSVDAKTVNTGVDSRDNHLRGSAYFDVAHYPKISFKSDKVAGSGKAGSYTVSGKLTIKGTTKDITIPFTAVPNDGGYLFEGSFEIDRRDFKVGGNSLVMSNNVKITLHVVAKKK